MTTAELVTLTGQRRPFVALAATDRPVEVHIGAQSVRIAAGDASVSLGWQRQGGGALLTGALLDPRADMLLLAACEALFGSFPELTHVALAPDLAPAAVAGLIAHGPAQLVDGLPRIEPDLLWQMSALWLPGSGGVFPQRLVTENGIRHPRRPPMRDGLLYTRFIPWLGQSMTFETADPERHLPAFHRWMNDPRVAEIWEETGDLAQHRAYLEERRADPHVVPVIGSFGGVPFGYFELYWARENRLGPHYEAQDYDRGWHVLVGEEAFRGKAYISAWLPSLMHFMFLDDPRTQRIVGEPRATHAQQIRNLDRSGFAKVKHVDFSHKRALLVMLLRERFFGDRLWEPDFDATAQPVLPVAAQAVPA